MPLTHDLSQIEKKIKSNGNLSGTSTERLLVHSNWSLEMLVFEERGKPEYPEKNLSSREENQQQTQPTYGVESENRSRATLVGGECSHHYTIPAPEEQGKKRVVIFLASFLNASMKSHLMNTI